MGDRQLGHPSYDIGMGVSSIEAPVHREHKAASEIDKTVFVIETL